MTPTRAVVVHSLDQMLAAVRAADRFGLALAVVSAPHAAASLGPELFRAMIDRVRPQTPSDSIRFVLDCGPDPGLALAAFRAGIPWVRVSLPDSVLAKVEAIGRALGGRIDAPATDLPTLDLADRRDAAAACEAWLDQARTRPDTGPAPSCLPGERRPSQSRGST